jgi:hypothetical protein
LRHIYDRGVPPPLFAPCLLLAGNAKFKSVFLSLEFRFLFETLGACIAPLLFCCSALCKAF